MSTPVDIDADDPAWEHLPDDPLAFFGLQGEFDRRDLKRSYNRWLRRFKPEHFPAEFQKIRTAFEFVDDHLRYRPAEQETAPPLNFGLALAEKFAEKKSADHGDIIARLKDLTPEALFESIRSQPHKSPNDFFHLAVLSDTTSCANPQDFISWLCAGHEAHPGNSIVLNFLYAYCHSEVQVPEVEALLKRLAKTLPVRDFGFVTERLWIELLRESGFEMFRETFDSCWREMRRQGTEGRFALIAQLTRRAIFLADEDWLEEQMEFLWEHCDGVAWGEHEVEVLDLLVEYRMSRDSFLNGDEVRIAIDDVCVAICEEEEEEADRLMISWVVEYGRQGQDVLNSLLPEEEHPYIALSVLQYYCYELSERLGEEPILMGPAKSARLTAQFLLRINKLSNRSLWGLTMNSSDKLGYIGVPALLLYACVKAVEITPESVSPWLAGPFYFAICALAFWKLFIPILERISDQLAKRCYESLWRDECLAFLGREEISIDEFINAILANEGDSEFGECDRLVRRIVLDPGLATMSLILRRF